MTEEQSTIALHTLCLGKGKGSVPVLLLHGWGHTLGMLRPLGELIAEHTEVHLVDLPGHGRSDEPNEVWGMEEFARRILDYLDEQGLAQVDIVGHSFGGKTAIKLSSIQPRRVRRLVLMSSSGLRPRRSLKRRFRMAWIGALRSVVKRVDKFFNLRYFEEWFIPRFASPDYLSAGSFRKTFVKSMNEELPEELRAIKFPVLLLWGEEDTETPLEIAERMERLIPDTRLITLSGVGHEPFLGPGAHVCYRHISPFLGIEEQSLADV